jgi:hypothetical protein
MQKFTLELKMIKKREKTNRKRQADILSIFIYFNFRGTKVKFQFFKNNIL